MSNGSTANNVSNIIYIQCFNSKGCVFAVLLRKGIYISRNSPNKIVVFTINDILSFNPSRNDFIVELLLFN